jgi:hypothetical protein
MKKDFFSTWTKPRLSCKVKRVFTCRENYRVIIMHVATFDELAGSLYCDVWHRMVS